MSNTLLDIVTEVYYEMGEKSDNLTYDQKQYVIPRINSLVSQICKGEVKDIIMAAKGIDKVYKAGDLIFLRKKIPILQVLATSLQADLNVGDTTITTDTTNYSDCIDITQDLQNATAPLGQTVALGVVEQQAQTFKAIDDNIQQVSLRKKSNSGAFIGDVVITLQDLSSGFPSGTILATKTISNADRSLIPDDTEFTVSLSSTLTFSKQYAIVISSTTSDDLNHPNLGFQNTDVYSNGTAQNKINSVRSSYTGDLYFKVYSLRYIIIQGNAISYTGKTSSLLTGVGNVTFNIKSGQEIRQLYKIPAEAHKMFRLFRWTLDNDEIEIPYQDFRYEKTDYRFFTVITNGSTTVQLIDIINLNKQDYLFYLYYYAKSLDLVEDTDLCILPDDYGKQVVAPLVAGELLRVTEENAKAQTLLAMGYAKLQTMYTNFAQITAQPRMTVKWNPIGFKNINQGYGRVIQGSTNC